MREDFNLLRFPKLSHNACLMRWCVVIMQESEVLESCFGDGGFGRSFSIFLMQHFYNHLLLLFSLLAQEFAALDPYYRRKSHT